MAGMTKLREDLSRRFLDALNQGRLPWAACWQQSRPINAVTGKFYRGVNAFYLSYLSDELGYTDPRWCTYVQAKGKGWQVRENSTGVKVEFWSYYDTRAKKLLTSQEVQAKIRSDPDYRKNIRVTARTYTVFNAAQIERIPPMEFNHTDIGSLRDQRDVLLSNMAVAYREKGNEAYYNPGTDTITLPPEAAFEGTYSYMATLLHECSHATGHESRLCRDLSGGLGSELYAREELRAEISSAFTAQAIGIRLTDAQLAQQTERHAAYIQSWGERLKEAPEELFSAIKDAGEISDYLIEKGGFSKALEAAPESIDPLVSPRTMMELSWNNPGMTREQLVAIQNSRQTMDAWSPPEIATPESMGLSAEMNLEP